MKRPLAVALLLLVLGAALLALSGGQLWVTVHVPPSDLVGTASGSRDVALTGNQLGGGLSALALAALAAGAALLATRGKGRLAVAVVTTVVGLGAMALAAYQLATAGAIALSAGPVTSVLRTGATGSLPTSASGWPYLGIVAGLLVAVAGVLATRGATASRGLSSRYEPPTTPTAPTGSAAVEPQLQPPAGSAVESEPELEAAAWSALDRGEDPTVRG